MKVLLIQDVDNLGYAGDIKKVANGYGRNYLMPQNMAVLATSGALKQAETIRKSAEKIRARDMEDAKAISAQLSDLELVFERRSSDTGKLYGSVTTSDISEAIKAKTEIEINKRKIALPEPIRNIGFHDVTLKLMIDVVTKIKVEVVPEGTIVERTRQARKAAEAAATQEAEAEATTIEETVTEVVEPVAEVETVVETDEPVAETVVETDE